MWRWSRWHDVTCKISKTSTDISIRFSFLGRIRLARSARQRMQCYSSLNRDLRRREWYVDLILRCDHSLTLPRNSSMCAADVVTSFHDTRFWHIAFDFLVLRRSLDLDFDKRSLDWAPSGTETCYEGKISNSMTKVSNAVSPMLFTPVILIHHSYKCMGASDNIFDHFIFLSSVPTIPIEC